MSWSSLTFALRIAQTSFLIQFPLFVPRQMYVRHADSDIAKPKACESTFSRPEHQALVLRLIRRHRLQLHNYRRINTSLQIPPARASSTTNKVARLNRTV